LEVAEIRIPPEGRSIGSTGLSPDSGFAYPERVGLATLMKADMRPPSIPFSDGSRGLLDARARILESTFSLEAPAQAIEIVADAVRTKTALVTRAASGWAVVAEAGHGPAIPNLTGSIRHTLDRVGDGPDVDFERWTESGADWTLVGLTRRAGSPAVLLIHKDWSASATALVQVGRHVLLAQRANALTASARVRVATHRLSRALARATGVRSVSEIAVRSAARAVRAQVAALAVANPDGRTLAITATYGYPLALVEHLRIRKGDGVLGSVFESRLPLHVDDVTKLTGARRRRARYRTNSFAVVPITAGADVVGVLSVTDRSDGRPFAHGDLSTLRTLAATTALALVRERAHAQATSYAQAAAIDPVSGLFNRRYFQARLEEELQRAQRHAMAVGLLMIDVDDFKSINDRFGHLAGDAVIGDIGEILRRSVRVFDICTRFGGEEFAVVMPGSGPEDAARIAERIRERIEAYRSSVSDLSMLRITASIGLSVSSAGTSARDLVSAADQALYQAKRNGKNQVRVADVIPPPASAGGQLPA